MGFGIAGAFVASTVLSAASSYMGYQAAGEQAKAGKKAAKRHARFIAKRNKLEQSIAIEKFELEVAMETERLTHETEYVTGQLEKRKARVSGEAVASYAASGVTVGEGSAEAVLERIEGEFESDIATVRETAELELKQFTESGQKSLDWFLEQSTMETQYGVQSSLDEASAYGSQASYAQTGSFLGPASQLLSGYASYGMYQSSLSSPGGMMNIT